MHIEIEQKIDFRFAREFDAALYRHHTHRAVRFRPIMGLALMALALGWMASHASGGATVVIVAFVFFWGLLLTMVEWLRRFRGFLRLSRALRPGRVELVRFDSRGASQRSDRALLQVVRWQELHRMDFLSGGVLLTGPEIAPIFVSSRNLQSQALSELKQFLLREWPDRVHA